MYKRKSQRGFSLLELLITMGIFLVVIGIIVRIMSDLLNSGNNFQQSFLTQRDAIDMVQTMVAEAREMGPSDLGGYPIEIAISTSFAFFTNVDKDPLRERVQYYLSGNTLRKSVIKPAGNPLSYSTTSSATEYVRTVLTNIVLTNQPPLFSYRTSGDATTTNITIDQMHLLYTRFAVDQNPNAAPPAFIVDGVANFRNLKDY